MPSPSRSRRRVRTRAAGLHPATESNIRDVGAYVELLREYAQADEHRAVAPDGTPIRRSRHRPPGTLEALPHVPRTGLPGRDVAELVLFADMVEQLNDAARRRAAAKARVPAGMVRVRAPGLTSVDVMEDLRVKELLRMLRETLDLRGDWIFLTSGRIMRDTDDKPRTVGSYARKQKLTVGLQQRRGRFTVSPA